MQCMEPPSFDAEWYDDWCTWVLGHGLPRLPATLVDDDAVPVARWVGPRFGAVLLVDWGGHADDKEGQYLSSEIEVFRRVGEDWQPPATGGGGGWFDPPFDRPDVPADYAVLVHYHDGGGPLPGPSEQQPTWRYSSAYGFTGTAAQTVEVEDRDGTLRTPIESPLGVFIVVADATQRAVVRVRRRDGKVLLEQRFSPPATRDDSSHEWGND